MKARIALAVGLAAAVLAGCGGGSSAPPKPDSAKHAVEAFIADVKKGDWKDACAVVDPVGRTALALRIGVNLNTELDKFGEVKNCPASLAAHADKARLLVKGADPGATHPVHNGAQVSSARGVWSVAAPLPQSRDWLVDAFPPPH
jgi:hypothetical protein